MALDALRCNHLAPLGFKGLITTRLVGWMKKRQWWCVSEWVILRLTTATTIRQEVT